MSGSQIEPHMVDLSGCLGKPFWEPEGAPTPFEFDDFLPSIACSQLRLGISGSDRLKLFRLGQFARKRLQPLRHIVETLLPFGSGHESEDGSITG